MPPLSLGPHEFDPNSIEAPVYRDAPDLELIRGDLDPRSLQALFATATQASYAEDRADAQAELAERLGQWLINVCLAEVETSQANQQARALAARRFQLAWCMSRVTEQFELLVIRPADKIVAIGKLKMGLPLDARDGFLATAAYSTPDGRIHFQGQGKEKPYIAPADSAYFILQLLPRRPITPQQSESKPRATWKRTLRNSLKGT